MRKTIYASLLVAGLMVIAGCNKSTEATSPGGGKFSLKGPSNTPATEVKQGETKTVEISINESKDFKEEITLTATVEPADKGVTATLDPKTVKGGDVKKTELKIAASDKANAGKYVVTVKGKAKGADTSVNVEVKVPEKK
ncbi:MAG TPA: hypothetical protein VN688_18685 [Gemmataceae bacterium]|nr:hypothetical protein [Gemmataceae bacterium]